MNYLQIKKMKQKIKSLRKKLISGKPSIGSWIQIPSIDNVSILSNAGYEWLTIDMEHGSFNIGDLPELISTIISNECIPLVRIPKMDEHYCKAALDAGALGLIIPMIKNSHEVELAIKYSCWPPKGTRGVGYSNSNLFGKYFDEYKYFTRNPLIVAQIENKEAYEDLDNILKIKMLDAVMIGPYDLSYSLNNTADFDDPHFKNVIKMILLKSKKRKKACGIHIVSPDVKKLKKYVNDGFDLIAYSTDANFLIKNANNPLEQQK